MPILISRRTGCHLHLQVVGHLSALAAGLIFEATGLFGAARRQRDERERDEQAGSCAYRVFHSSVPLDGDYPPRAATPDRCWFSHGGVNFHSRVLTNPFQSERDSFLFGTATIGFAQQLHVGHSTLDWQRKRRLRAIMPRIDCRLQPVLSIEQRGRDLFQLACDEDLEGIVAKWTGGTYQGNGAGTSWFKIKNPAYTEAEGPRELFEQRREGPARRRRSVAPALCLA